MIVEVRLVENSTVGVTCKFIFEGKPSVYVEIKSTNMVSAQREVTKYMSERSFKPLGKWKSFAINERKRVFRLVK